MMCAAACHVASHAVLRRCTDACAVPTRTHASFPSPRTTPLGLACTLHPP